MIISKLYGKVYLLHLFIISSGFPFIINLNSLDKKLYTIAAEPKLPFKLNFLYILNLYVLVIFKLFSIST